MEGHFAAHSPRQKGRFWAPTRLPQKQPNHPYATCRAVYQLLVRPSKTCWRALMRSARSAHVSKASRGACTSCRMNRARAIPPSPTSDSKRTQSCGCRPHFSFPRRTQLLQVCLKTSRRASRKTEPLLCSHGVHMCEEQGQQWSGAGRPPLDPGHPLEEPLPEHLGCTNTIGRPFVVCLGPVRRGGVIGGHPDGAKAEACLGSG